MNLDLVTGINHNDLVGDSLKLESHTFLAFKKMEEAAKKDGIILKIVSAHRSFERQNFIWNKKYDKFTNEYSLNPMDAINEIIRFSTILEHLDTIGEQILTSLTVIIQTRIMF